MITWEQGISTWAERWRNLRAYEGRVLQSLVTIRNVFFPERWGTAWSHRNEIAVYRSDRFSNDLDTIIHEFAHLARSVHHEADWQECYADAIREVTGIPIPRQANNYEMLVRAGREAMASWWKTSGNAFLWHLASKGKVL